MVLDAKKHSFEVVYLQGEECLYAEARLDRDTVPDAIRLYDASFSRDIDHGVRRIAHHISKDFAGTLLARKSLGLSDGGEMPVKDSFNWTNERKTLLEYVVGKAFSWRAVSELEAPYLYNLLPEQDRECGCIGHWRGVFGRSGGIQWYDWWVHNEALHTQEFRFEMNLLMNFLEDRMLAGIRPMQEFCDRTPGADLGDLPRIYGFRADTNHYSYLLRCEPGSVFHFHLYAYDTKTLDQYILQHPSSQYQPVVHRIRYYSPLSAYVWVPEPGRKGFQIRKTVPLIDKLDMQERIRAYMKEQRPDYPGGYIHEYNTEDAVKRKMLDISLDIEQRGNSVWAVADCIVAKSLTTHQVRLFERYWKKVLRHFDMPFGGHGIETEAGSLRLELYSPDSVWHFSTEQELDQTDAPHTEQE